VSRAGQQDGGVDPAERLRDLSAGALEALAHAAAVEVSASAQRLGVMVAVAESLTGGLVAGTLAGVPGVSAVLRGAVVAYVTDLKASLLGVDGELLARGGAVQAEVAAQMARGVAAGLGADFGVATTGVAGPDPQDGHGPGVVHIAVHGPRVDEVVSLQGPGRLGGDRAQVRWASVVLALCGLNRALSAAEARGVRVAARSPEEEDGPAGR
jgi:nicotinamide-nucleotide amidase